MEFACHRKVGLAAPARKCSFGSDVALSTDLDGALGSARWPAGRHADVERADVIFARARVLKFDAALSKFDAALKFDSARRCRLLAEERHARRRSARAYSTDSSRASSLSTPSPT
jgi:hypothetical protein